MRKLLNTIDRLAGRPTLFELLREIVRPARAAAFEKLQPADALVRHPELKSAYNTVRAATNYFAAKYPSDEQAQLFAVTAVRNHIQSQLNLGAINELAPAREPSRASPESPNSELSPKPLERE